MGERQPLERDARRAVGGQRCHERLGQLDLAGRRVKRQLDLDRVSGLDPGALAHRPIQPEQELTAHAGHGGAPRVAVHRGEDREAFCSFADGGDLSVVEDDGRRWAARRQGGRPAE